MAVQMQNKPAKLLQDKIFYGKELHDYQKKPYLAAVHIRMTL